MTNRTQTITRKFKTAFGSMYLHVERDAQGFPVGGSISNPGKEPDSQIALLIDQVSEALSDAMKGMGER